MFRVRARQCIFRRLKFTKSEFDANCYKYEFIVKVDERTNYEDEEHCHIDEVAC